MKKNITILAVFFSFSFCFSQNISVNINYNQNTDWLKIQIANNGAYPLFLIGPLGISDDAGNVMEETKSYYYINLYDAVTNEFIQVSEKKYFGRTEKYSMFLPVIAGSYYEVYNPFNDIHRTKGFFSSVYGTYKINLTVHLDFRYYSTPSGVRNQMNITSNTITITVNN